MSRRLPLWEEHILTASDDTLAQVECFEEGETTMELARDLSKGLREGQHGLVMLREQLRGRGRRGRSWIRPEVPFTGTFVSRLNITPDRLSGFSLLVGIAVVYALREFDVETKLKWPNDILSLQGKKLGGILIEVALQESTFCLLTGIGINIAGLPPNMTYPVTSLDELTPRSITPPELGASIARNLIPRIDLFAERGFGYFREEWLSVGPAIGSEITISASEESWRGRFLGVSEDGALMVHNEARGAVTLHSGEIVS